jgi:hypothetical protein
MDDDEEEEYNPLAGSSTYQGYSQPSEPVHKPVEEEYSYKPWDKPSYNDNDDQFKTTYDSHSAA